MLPIDMSRVLFGDDDVPNEALVQILVDEIRKGRSLPAPVLMLASDGLYDIVDGRNRIEAARRCGATEVSAYVIDDVGQERLGELRRSLNARRASN